MFGTLKNLDLEESIQYLKPDILIFSENGPTVDIIEVKTTGRHPIGRYQMDTYEKLQKALFGKHYKAEVYYLLSEGHEKNSDFELLAEKQARIFRWEDIMKMFEGCNLPFNNWMTPNMLFLECRPKQL